MYLYVHIYIYLLGSLTVFRQADCSQAFRHQLLLRLSRRGLCQSWVGHQLFGGFINWGPQNGCLISWKIDDWGIPLF